MTESPGAVRFACTARGEVARGKRRLALGLLTLTVAMVVFGVWIWFGGRKVPGVLAVLAGLLGWTAWRMSGDLDPLWLELTAGRLAVQMRRKRISVPLFDPRARRLTAEEGAHLRLLASRGGIVAGTGGFDSRLLGEFNLYASDLERAVLVDTGELRLVVTPDDPEAFLQALGSEESAP